MIVIGMEPKTKSMIEELVKNEKMIPSRIWHSTLQIDDGFLSVARNGHMLWRNSKGIQEVTLKTFFLKKFRKDYFNELAIRNTISDYLLFTKGKTLCARDIVKCRNAEIRKMLLLQYGYERFMKELQGKVVQKEGEHELIIVRWNKWEEPIKLVKVKDSTTGKFYVLRVPLSVKTCKEAVAWTFSMKEEDYFPEKET
jgi:hypothetical protein